MGHEKLRVATCPSGWYGGCRLFDGGKRMLRLRSISVCLAVILTTGIAAAQATVKNESQPVYAERDTGGAVVKTLHRGDAVEIEMSITGEGGVQWCSIRESGQNARLG